MLRLFKHRIHNALRLERIRGFTMVEALMAIVLLGFSSFAFFASLYASYNLVNDIRENIIATSIIQEEMEILRKTAFSSLPPSGTSSFSNSSLSSLYNSSGSLNVDQYIDADIIRIAITVTWYSRLNTSNQNTERAVTLITRKGINSI